MHNLETQISLFRELIHVSAKPVNADKVAKDVIMILELFEDHRDLQLLGTENIK